MAEHNFNGFPERAEVTPVPNLFFSGLLSEIDDIAELKLTLYLFWLLSRKKGYPRMVTFSELAAEPLLKAGLGDEQFEQILERSLQLAVGRGTLLVIDLEKGQHKEKAYLINSESERRALARIERGELSLPQWTVRPAHDRGPARISDIFTLYEQNIGMITPIISEELKEAEDLYPTEWIEDAFKEAATLNKRNWKYISKILERWSIEGKADGQSGAHTGKQGDTGKYTRGKYGHLVER